MKRIVAPALFSAPAIKLDFIASKARGRMSAVIYPIGLPQPAELVEKTMVVAALGLLSVELWLTFAVTVLLALRLHRALQLSGRLVAITARPRPHSAGPNPVR